MKLVFLDIDGVLNAHEKLPSGYCGICRPFVDRLNCLLERVPDAVIVVSSAWRYLILRGDMTLKGFEALLLVHGVRCKGRLHGHTVADGAICDEPDHFDAEAWKVAGLRMRAEQILRYAAAHRPAAWVAIDDLPLKGLRFFVQTDGAKGLQANDVARAINILSEDQP